MGVENTMISCFFHLSGRLSVQALCAAAITGHVDMVQLLLENGAEVTAEDKVNLLSDTRVIKKLDSCVVYVVWL